jgi:hypothetical protein
MAKLTSRKELKEYCLRKLGFPVIEINVDDKQVEDRIDDALLFLKDYHYDFLERMFVFKQITTQDIANKYIDLTQPTLADSTYNITYADAIDPTGDRIITITKLMNLFGSLQGGGAGNIMGINYQIAQSDVFGITGLLTQSIVPYFMVMQHLGLLQDILNPEKQITFQKHDSKLKIHVNWQDHMLPGTWIGFEAWFTVKPEDNPSMWDNRLLKELATLYIKRQWAQNISKFAGMTLPGGLVLDATTMMQEASFEIGQIEQRVRDEFQEPPGMMVG